MNNKFILLFLIFSIGIKTYSQDSSGKIVYKIKTAPLDTINMSSKSKSIFKAASENAEKQTFNLTFEKNRSSFIQEANLKNDNQDKRNEIISKIASLLFTSKFNFYIDKQLSILLLQNQDGVLIKKDYKLLEWQITNETKTISDYLCYKATYKKIIIDSKKKQREILVTAWFTPSLPYSFGPKEYFGLPGLIIELQENQNTFYATNIKLFEKNTKITFPKGKTITYEEYEQKILSSN